MCAAAAEWTTLCASVFSQPSPSGLWSWRERYTPGARWVRVWVVKASDITASDPRDKDMYFDPMEDKVYRHPTFYKLPDSVDHM